MEVKKGHKSFVEFLDKELPALGLTHWYGSYDSYGTTCDYHDIGKRVVTEYKLFGLPLWSSRRRICIANIIAEPDSPVYKGACDAFRVRVNDHESHPVLQQLAEKFEDATFGLKAELVY